MRELQSLINMLPGLIKALPILVAWLVLIRFAVGTIKDWRAPMAAQEIAYALIGLAAFLWAIAR